jgi:hypothetical protein
MLKYIGLLMLAAAGIFISGEYEKREEKGFSSFVNS